MLKFFGIRGDTGRVDYVVSSFIRGLIAAVLNLAVLAFLGIAAPTDLQSAPPYIPMFTPLTDWDLFVTAQTAPGAYGLSVISGLIDLLFLAPVTCRRANDIGMNYCVIAPVLFIFLLPGRILGSCFGVGVWVFLSAFNLVIELILMVKPGKTHKQWLRSRQANEK